MDKYFDLSKHNIGNENIKIVIGPRGAGKTLSIMDHIYRDSEDGYSVAVYRFLCDMEHGLWSYYQQIFKREDLRIVPERDSILYEAVYKGENILSCSTTCSSILSFDGTVRTVKNVMLHDDVLYYCRTDKEAYDMIKKIESVFPEAKIWVTQNPYDTKGIRKLSLIHKESDIIPFDYESIRRYVNSLYGDGGRE